MKHLGALSVTRSSDFSGRRGDGSQLNRQESLSDCRLGHALCCIEHSHIVEGVGYYIYAVSKSEALRT